MNRRPRPPRKSFPGLFFEDNPEELHYNGASPRLPKWYHPAAFRNDVLSMFAGRKPALGRRNLAAVRNLVTEKSKFDVREWAKISRFFARFPKSRFFEKIADFFDNRFEAARYLLDLFRVKSDPDGRFGYRDDDGDGDDGDDGNDDDYFGPGDLADAMCSCLSSSSDDGNDDGTEVPFLPPGKKAGSGHEVLKYLRKAEKVREALKDVLVKYRGASEVDTERVVVDEPADDIEPEYIRSVNDVTSAFPSQFALPDLLFDYRLATRQILVPQHIRYDKKPKKYIMLLDVSGSMDGTKAIYAAASAIALVKNVQKSGLNEAKVVLFDDRPHEDEVIDGTADDAITKLMEVPFSGGGTSIDKALEYADGLGVDETVVVTDGEDRVNYVPKTKTYCVFVGSHDNVGLAEKCYSYERVKVKK